MPLPALVMPPVAPLITPPTVMSPPLAAVVTVRSAVVTSGRLIACRLVLLLVMAPVRVMEVPPTTNAPAPAVKVIEVAAPPVRLLVLVACVLPPNASAALKPFAMATSQLLVVPQLASAPAPDQVAACMDWLPNPRLTRPKPRIRRVERLTAIRWLCFGFMIVDVGGVMDWSCSAAGNPDPEEHCFIKAGRRGDGKRIEITRRSHSGVRGRNAWRGSAIDKIDEDLLPRYGDRGQDHDCRSSGLPGWKIAFLG